MSVRAFGELRGRSVGDVVHLDRQESRYVARVRRCRVGDYVDVLDGAGVGFRAQLVDANGSCRLELVAALASRPTRRQVRLWLALAEVDATSTAVRYATQCGADSVQLVRSRHSAPRAPSEDRVEKILRETLRQCGRLAPPRVSDATSLDACLQDPIAELGDRFVANAREDQPATPPTPGSSCTLAVGPEGGWHAEELAQLHAAGFEDLGLGPHVMTTPVAVAAGLGLLLGLG